VLIAIGNASTPHPILEAATRRLLDDASPLVRATAVWAYSRLAEPREISTEAEWHLARETDDMVRAEWERLVPRSPAAAQ
jgi:epoxyqueuosine reductase